MIEANGRCYLFQVRYLDVGKKIIIIIIIKDCDEKCGGSATNCDDILIRKGMLVVFVSVARRIQTSRLLSYRVLNPILFVFLRLKKN